MIKLRRLAAIAACYLVIASVHAADVPSDAVIVTATRTAQTVDETLTSVTVITRKDIERRQATSVQDVLQGVPGLSLANNGGLGKFTSVFLRGTEADHVLVLIDGVKVGSATSGTTAFQDLPIEQIERIEIVRGPRSSLYGSEAIGGVIQIFTRKGGGATVPALSLGVGSHRTYQGSAGLSGGDTNGWYSASIAGIGSRGFNACEGRAFPPGGGCFTFEPDDDGYHNRSGALRLGRRFDNGVEVDLHALRARGDNEFDGSIFAGNESEFLQDVIGGHMQFSPTESWQTTLTAGRSRDESDSLKDGVFVSRFDTRRNTLSFQNDITLGTEHVYTVGIDSQNDEVDGTTAYAVTSRRDTGVFVQYQGAFGAHNIELAGRTDDNEQFGHHQTGSLAWGYANSEDGPRFTASYGTAFKAPSFNELYFPFFGNPDLDPERSKSVELGVRDQVSWGRWSLNAHHTDVDDLIAVACDPVTFICLPVNVGQARIRGLEAVVGTQLVGWDVNAGLTLLDPKDRRSGPNRGNLLPRRAEEMFNLDLNRATGPWRFGATLNAVGRRYDDLANTRRLGGYATVDARAEYALTKDVALGARIGNAFDKEYETAKLFNQDGRNFFFTVRYQPGQSSEQE